MSRPRRPWLLAGLVGLALAGFGLVGLLSTGSSGAGPGHTSATTAGSAGSAWAGQGSGANALTVYDLADPIAEYQTYVTVQLGVLAHQTSTLATDVSRGDLVAARVDWLTAHLTYHRLGGAYDSFGALGAQIDGLAQGQPLGVEDPSFTGFHRVEYLLWRSPSPSGPGQVSPAVLQAADQLAHLVDTLQAQASSLNVTPETFTVRAHEILENTLQFQLTGQDDYGSHTSLATAAADLQGTQIVIGFLRDLLQQQAPGLPVVIDHDLALVRTALGAATPAGQNMPITDLPTASREQVDAAVDRAVETLAQVPGLLQVQDD